MQPIKIILTGATGMVGEGVLLECIRNEKVSEILIVGRRHYEIVHPKVRELIVPDFFKLDEVKEKLTGYDGCFYCAGISSVGMNEKDYTKITYDTTIHFATVVLAQNPGIVFDFVSGRSTDSSEKGKWMWARVKGRTENALMKMNFKGVYNFRPGFMKAFKEQKNVNAVYRAFNLFYPKIFPASSLTLSQVGRAMIKTITDGYQKQILEIADIKILAK